MNSGNEGCERCRHCGEAVKKTQEEAEAARQSVEVETKRWAEAATAAAAKKAASEVAKVAAETAEAAEAASEAAQAFSNFGSTSREAGIVQAAGSLRKRAKTLVTGTNSFAWNSSNVISLGTVALTGLSMFSGVAFVVLRFHCRSSTMSEPLLATYR